MPIVSCKDLTKVYITGDVRVDALRGVTLAVQEGEMVAIMGPSGCGKTTLLNCLAGLDDATSGTVWLDSLDLTTCDDDAKSELRANRMGFIFQFYNLLPVLSATENVELPLLLVETAPEVARDKALKLLDRVGLRDRAALRPSSLSGGERQRVAIARSLVNDPAIVFADEPTGDLDKRTAGDIIALLGQLNREHGQTFIIVTHDPEVGEVCDRIVRMRDGLVIGDEATARGTAKKLMVGG